MFLLGLCYKSFEQRRRHFYFTYFNHNNDIKCKKFYKISNPFREFNVRYTQLQDVIKDSEKTNIVVKIKGLKWFFERSNLTFFFFLKEKGSKNVQLSKIKLDRRSNSMKDIPKETKNYGQTVDR